MPFYFKCFLKYAKTECYTRGNKNATKHVPKVFMNLLFYAHQENGIGNPFKETIQAIVKARRWVAL